MINAPVHWFSVIDLRLIVCLLHLVLFRFVTYGQPEESAMANPSTYLNDLKKELQKEWPNNRTINLVFHGHSVPAGFFKTPEVNILSSYPA